MVDRTTRFAAPAVVALFVVLAVLFSQRPWERTIPVAAAVIALALALGWRRVEGWPLVAGLAVTAAGVLLIADGQSANLGWFGVCVLSGWVALTAPTPRALAFCALMLAVFVAQWLAQTEEPGWAAWACGTVLTTLAAGFSRRNRILVEKLQEAQAGLAERARAEERAHLAGEMHDVIGHALTVSLLHVSSARLALDDDPEVARTSLDEAERLARASLEEVRAAVGLMRTDGQATVSPLPGAEDLPELVESFRRAGTPVQLEVAGNPAVLGANAGLAVYRIVQESLTNAARHAPGEAASVRVEVGADGTTVQVLNGGVPRPTPEDGSGLVSMRERAAALGGRVSAGPCPAGWRVEAWLPS